MSSSLGSPFSTALNRHPWAKGALYATLCLVSAVFVFPMLWMMSTSLKEASQTMVFPPSWFPWPAQWHNYVDATHYIPFMRYALNTLIICVLSVIGMTFASAMTAYAFSRLTWPGRDLAFSLLLATMMVPFPVTMVPLYAIFKALGWVGTLNPLWVPAFFGNAFNIFLLRQFFLRIPKNFGEAMSLEGASEFQIFTQIYLPLSKSALAVVALFQFVFAWNDFLGPLLYLSDEKTYTLSLGLQQFQSQHGGTEWHLLMAASVLTVLPMLLLFFLTQKTFLQGMTFLNSIET